MEPKPHEPPAERGRERFLEREREMEALVTGQHGVIARRQLEALGLGAEAIKGRIRTRRLLILHRGVYSVGHRRVGVRGHWMAAVLACGEGALLSHQSASALWGLMRPRTSPVDVVASHGRPGRTGIRLHRARIHPKDMATNAGIPVTSVARTILDLADVLDKRRWGRAAEEADRLGLLEMKALEGVCDRGGGRRGVGACRRLIEAARAPITTRSPLEDRFAAFCDKHDLPTPARNVDVLGHEADVYWPRHRLVVELDGFAYHRHRAAFERDRARDAALQAAGYRVLHLTHRRLESEGAVIAAQLRKLLGVEQ